MSLTRIAGLPGSTGALGTQRAQLEAPPSQIDRAAAVARALRQMDAALARQHLHDRARAALDKATTALLDKFGARPHAAPSVEDLRRLLMERDLGRSAHCPCSLCQAIRARYAQGLWP